MDNFLQQLGQGYGALPQAAPDFAQGAQTVPQFAQLAPGVQSQIDSSSHPRRSILDTIGKLSDVFARVGGADPLYQPTLDAQADRTRAIDLDALKKHLLEQQVTSGQQGIDDTGNARLGQAVRGLQAIKAAGGDITKAWPLMSQQMGIPADRAAVIGHALATDPNALAGFVAGLNPVKNEGSQPKEIQIHALLQAKDPALASKYLESLVNPHAEVTPYQQAMIKIAQDHVGIDQTRTNLDQQKFDYTKTKPAGGNAKTGGKIDTSTALDLLDNIQGGFGDLHGMKALPGEATDTLGNILGGISRSGIGQYAGEQLGTPAAQKRLEIAKNVSNLQQELLKSLPASATRTKFEQEMLARGLPDPSKMDYKTAQTVISQLRASYLKAVQASATPQNRTLPPKLTAPARPAGNGGWGKATVIGN